MSTSVKNTPLTTAHTTSLRALRPWAALITAGALALAGCSHDGGTAGGYGGGTGTEDSAEATESPDGPDGGTMTGVDLATAETDLGTVVTDGQGTTLYYFTNDEAGTDTSACTGECLEAWPIAVAAGDEPAVDESVTGDVGTITSPDGEQHLTLDGMPLYYFVQDTAPVDVNGQGVNGVWYVVAPDGELITE